MDPGPTVQRIDISPGAVTLTGLGASRELSASATGPGGVVPGLSFVWESTVPDVVGVDPSGTVTAYAPGMATITASAEGVTGSAEVSVEQQIASLTVTPGASVVSGVEAVLNLEATAFDTEGSAMPPPEVTWTSTNENVATVTPLALSTAALTTRRDGQVSIAATAGGVTGYALVSVNIAAVSPARTWIRGGTTPRTLNAIWGSAPDDIWAVGSTGTIRHFDGVRWSDASPGLTTATLAGVWGTGPDDVWAVGNGVTLHYDGTAWSEVSIPGAEIVGLRSAWGSAPNAAWAACISCPPHRWDGARWSADGDVQRLNRIWGVAPDDVFAAGEGGVVARYDGLEWSTEQLGSPAYALRGVWGSDDDDVWIVGDWGTVQHFDGDQWIDYAGPTFGNSRLYSVWGSGPNDVYIVGGGNRVYRYDGGSWTWTVASEFGETLIDVWGSAGGDVWAVGAGVIARGVVEPIAEITDLTLASATITIGAGVGYDVTVTNLVGGTVFPVLLQAWIEQGATQRAGGGTAVNCGAPATAGDLPPDPCTFGSSLSASNAGSGSGTLVAGPAEARFELLLDGEVLDEIVLNVTLVN